MSLLITHKADKIELLKFKIPAMRAFHITWLTFFLCFFSWFGIAPLMPVIREELHLTKGQIGNIMLASVSITLFARIFIGWVCDKIGPRITYTVLLLVGALPVIFIGLSNSYESFLLFRLAIGVIGASFVVTQYHTTLMFNSKVVGTANATVAGWGNLGGGVTQMVMPLIFGVFVANGFAASSAWRLSMMIPGVLLVIMAIVYFFCTKDTMEGNFSSLKRNQQALNTEKGKNTSFFEICKGYRVWLLFLAYAASFGVEITIDNIAALYFKDTFDLSLAQAGIIAGTFGLMNIFARTLGGFISDKVAAKIGLNGRVSVLGIFLLLEGIGIILFSKMGILPLAVITMVLFALFVKMSNGAVFSIVPFVNKKAVGTVSGIVGAGGNAGALLFTAMFKFDGISYQAAFFIIGGAVVVISILTLLLRFSTQETIVPKVSIPLSDGLNG